MMTLEKFKELDQTYVLVSVRDSSAMYAIEREALRQKKIIDITREPGLEVEACRVHPINHYVTDIQETLCTDNLNILYIQENQIMKIPIPALRSKY